MTYITSIKNTKTIIPTIVIGIIAATMMVVILPPTQVFADPNVHGCMDNAHPNQGHCYAIANARWCVLGVCGDRQESGLSGTNITPTSWPSTVTSHFTTNPFWVIFDDGDWIEVGWIKGGGGICGTDTTAQGYWLKVQGGVPTHGCISASTSTTMSYELSDTNKDKTWILKISGTQYTTSAQDYTKGKLQAGGESIHSSNGMNGKVSSLQYYDTQWRNWDFASVTQISPYSVVWCTQPTSFAYGASPAC